ncbi:unnamed protein product [Spodoptera exigua]|nr:unnamed protein product [Spodoptera exigua]
MGGGDLNSKKSWHPNTMKNQERVWKAEQAAAEEKKRMVELQRERAEERDRAELKGLLKNNSTAPNNDDRLSWMYDKPDKKVDEEAYLLGKSIDKNAEHSDKLEQDVIPAVSRRVVGSSMMTTAGDAQVDMSRKIREDPLLLIKERERAARAALLNNPLQRRRLTELLRKEQESRKESKSKKTHKKKDKSLDDLLAAKLNALGGKKGIDLATLLDSDDSSDSSSSSSSSSEHKKKNKKKKKKAKQKKKKKKRERKYSSDSEDSEEDKLSRKKSKKDAHSSKKSSERQSGGEKEYRKRKSSEHSDSELVSKKRKKEYSGRREQDDDDKKSRHYDTKSSSRSERRPDSVDRDKRSKEVSHRDHKKRGGMTEEERAARLAEMAAAGAEREIQRGRRVAEQRAADVADEQATRGPRSSQREARALPTSLESRIHSNRHYIQRDKRHMNEHFARR